MGAPTVTVTVNEILTALNKPDEYILALVEVDGTHTKTMYMQRPFRDKPEWTATSVNYNIQDLIKNAQVIYQEDYDHA